MIDGLSCENCPDKKRCKEQQEKKNNIIKNILADIVDKAKICGCDIKEKTEILFQQIPDVTRCDVVLEKQLKQKEQECEKYKKFIETIKSRIKGYKESCDEFCQYDRKCCHSCFTGGAIELGEDIEMDINEVENER